jgi:hypothetical protein
MPADGIHPWSEAPPTVWKTSWKAPEPSTFAHSQPRWQKRGPRKQDTEPCLSHIGSDPETGRHQGTLVNTLRLWVELGAHCPYRAADTRKREFFSPDSLHKSHPVKKGDLQGLSLWQQTWGGSSPSQALTLCILTFWLRNRGLGGNRHFVHSFCPSPLSSTRSIVCLMAPLNLHIQCCAGTQTPSPISPLSPCMRNSLGTMAGGSL